MTAVLGQDADDLVERVVAIWPTPRVTEEHKGEWRRFLIELDGDIAQIAIEDLKRRQNRRPTFAEFQEACRRAWSSIPKRPDLELEHQVVDTEPALPIDEARALARQNLERAREAARTPRRAS